jgi:hypothetical protein
LAAAWLTSSSLATPASARERTIASDSCAARSISSEATSWASSERSAK